MPHVMREMREETVDTLQQCCAERVGKQKVDVPVPRVQFDEGLVPRVTEEILEVKDIPRSARQSALKKKRFPMCPCRAF